MTMYSDGIRGAAVTATTRAKVTPSAGNAYVEIPAGKGGTVVAVEILPIGTLETGVFGAGGKVEVVNTSIDWNPFAFYTDMPHELTSTSGGFEFQQPTVIKTNKYVPEKSKIEFYASPYDDQSQQFVCNVYWVPVRMGKEQYVDCGAGAATITQVTKASAHVTFNIPAEKGGTLIWAKALGLKAAAVVVGTDINYMGGTVDLRNISSPDMEPCQFNTGTPSGLVAGAYFAEARITPLEKSLPASSTLYVDYTPYNDAAQALYITICWEKA